MVLANTLFLLDEDYDIVAMLTTDMAEEIASQWHSFELLRAEADIDEEI